MKKRFLLLFSLIYVNFLFSWSNAEYISSQTSFPGSLSTQVAMKNGRAVAVWNSYDGSFYKIYVSIYSNNSWSNPEEISSGNSLRNNVQVAMNDDGKAVVVFNFTISGSTSSVYASNYDGNNWSTTEEISSASIKETHPQVAMNSSDNAITTWNYRADNLIYKIQTANYNGISWSAVSDISTGSSAINVKNDVQIDMNDSGDAVLVFNEYKDGLGYYAYESIYNGSSWSTPSALASASSEHTYPQVKMNSSGNAISVWSFGIGITSKIQYSAYNGSSWSAAVDIYSGIYVNNVQIDMNDSGNAILVFNYYDSSQVYESRYNGSSWTTPNYLSSASGEEPFPKITMNNSNNALAVWNYKTGSTYKIQTANYNGSSWSSVSDLSSGLSVKSNVQAAMDNNSDAAAVWLADGYVRETIYDNSTWSTDMNLSSGSIFFVPQLAMNNSNNAIAVWNLFNGSSYKIQYSKFNGTSWSAASDISSGDSFRNNVQIDMNDDGNAVVVFDFINGTNSYVYESIYNGSSWSTPTALSSSSSEQVHPQVTMNSSGNAIAVWNYKTGSTYKIQYSIFNGSNWSAAADISSGDSIRRNVQVKMNDENNSVVVFDHTTTAPKSYTYASNFNGSSWTSAAALSSSSPEQIYPQVDINDDDDAIAIWNHKIDSTYKIQTANYNGSSWSAASDISSGDSIRSEVQIDMNDNGKAVAIFDLTTDTPTSFIYALNYNGSSWTSAAALSSASTEQVHPQVAMNSSNIATSIWNFKSGNAYKVQSSDYDSSWSAASDISSTTVTPEIPQIKLNDNNDAIAVWKFGDAIQSSFDDNAPPI